jgi:hypothetical protein
MQRQLTRRSVVGGEGHVAGEAQDDVRRLAGEAVAALRKPDDRELELVGGGAKAVALACPRMPCQRGGGMGMKLAISSSSFVSTYFGVRPARSTLSEEAMISTPKPEVYAWMTPAATNMASTAASTTGDTSELTRVRAAMTEPGPIVTPRRTIACAPSQTPSPIVIGPLSYSKLGEVIS